MLPLYPKIAVYSDAKKQNFKVRLANVKLKDIDLWVKENLYLESGGSAFGDTQ